MRPTPGPRGAAVLIVATMAALMGPARTATPVAIGDAAGSAGSRRILDCGGCWPAAFGFTPNGKQLFYLERYSGEIHRYVLKTGRDSRWGQVGPVDGAGERGALGIAVDPRWDRGTAKQRKRHRWIYVFYTHADPLENRIVRLRRAGRGLQEQRLETISISTGSNHNGGPVHFGPDGKLYVATGEQAQPSRAQAVGDPAGKVLRMKRGGGIPSDNPFPGSRAYSIGHRNSFGFTFDPETDRLWNDENGPECEDEVNLVIEGGNYGWGAGSTCPNTSTEGPSPIGPKHEWTPTVVPTGAAFCVGCGLGSVVEGDLLIGLYGENEIRNLSLNAQRDGITGETTLLSHSSGVLAVERRPNGRVYFSDSDGISLLTA